MAKFAWEGVVQAYINYLPLSPHTAPVTLLEGNTPLLHAKNLERKFNGVKLYLKHEGLNPTGSFKDRGMTVAVTKAREDGAKVLLCASTGNTAASAAAYAARGGFKCAVILPRGAVALGKLAQALTYGAKVLSIQGNFDEALNIVRQISRDHSEIAVVNSINPYRLEGQKTAAFEICEHLGEGPDFLAIPVGNAGNITAYWKGFKEFYERRLIQQLPKMLGFQAEGAAPFIKGQPVLQPRTIATAIRIGNPANWNGAVTAVSESNGMFATVTDSEIIEAYHLLAREEGLFVEPASAASVAGLLKLGMRGYFPRGSVIVAVLTGHGLKDPDTAVSTAPRPTELPPQVEAVEREIASWLG